MQKYHVYFNDCFYDYNFFYEIFFTFSVKFFSFKYRFFEWTEFRDSQLWKIFQFSCYIPIFLLYSYFAIMSYSHNEIHKINKSILIFFYSVVTDENKIIALMNKVSNNQIILRKQII